MKIRVFGAVCLLSMTLAAGCEKDPLLQKVPLFDTRVSEPVVNDQLERAFRALQLKPLAADAWGKVAMLLFVHGNAEAALPYFSRAAKLDSMSFRWVYLAGYVRETLAADSVMYWFQRALALQPDYAPLHVRIGKTLLAAGLDSAAEAAFDRAISLDPELSHGLVGFATTLMRRNQLASARQLLERARLVNPAHRQVRVKLASIYQSAGDTEAVAREQEALAALPDSSVMPESVLAELDLQGVSSAWCKKRGLAHLREDRISAAIEEFQAALAARENAEGYYHLGQAFQRAEDLIEAELNYRKALRMDSLFVQARSNLGVVLYLRQKKSEAEQQLQLALLQNPEFVEAALHLVSIYRQEKQIGDAVQTLEAAMRHVPEDEDLNFQLAWLLAASKDDQIRDPGRALALSQALAIQTAERVPEVLDVLAISLAANRQFRNALTMNAKAEKLARENGKWQLVAQLASRKPLYAQKRVYFDESLY